MKDLLRTLNQGIVISGLVGGMMLAGCGRENPLSSVAGNDETSEARQLTFPLSGQQKDMALTAPSNGNAEFTPREITTVIGSPLRYQSFPGLGASSRFELGDPNSVWFVTLLPSLRYALYKGNMWDSDFHTYWYAPVDIGPGSSGGAADIHQATGHIYALFYDPVTKSCKYSIGSNPQRLEDMPSWYAAGRSAPAVSRMVAGRISELSSGWPETMVIAYSTSVTSGACRIYTSVSSENWGRMVPTWSSPVSVSGLQMTSDASTLKNFDFDSDGAGRVAFLYPGPSNSVKLSTGIVNYSTKTFSIKTTLTIATGTPEMVGVQKTKEQITKKILVGYRNSTGTRYTQLIKLYPDGSSSVHVGSSTAATLLAY